MALESLKITFSRLEVAKPRAKALKNLCDKEQVERKSAFLQRAGLSSRLKRCSASGTART
jgi:hypothetical protein